MQLRKKNMIQKGKNYQKSFNATSQKPNEKDGFYKSKMTKSFSVNPR